jgi:predicted transcriptional regulator
MKRTSCEYIVWHGLPVIRKEIAFSIVNDFGLNQTETASKLGITPPAVSQYFSGKRGKSNITDKELRKEIKKSAEKIIKDGDEVFVTETCRLCRLFTSKNYPSFNKIGGDHEIL